MYPNDEKWQALSLLLQKTSTHYSVSNFKKLKWQRYFLENIFIFLLQYMGLMQSTLNKTNTILWLANGTALAFLFLRGTTILPGIFLGSFLAYFSLMDIQQASVAACIHLLEPYVILITIYYFLGPSLFFNNKKEAILYIFIIATICSITTCFLIKKVNFNHWFFATCADFNGLIIIPLTLLTWDAYFLEWHAQQKFSSCLFFFSLILFSLIVILLMPFYYQILFFLCLFGVSLHQFKWCLNIALLSAIAFTFFILSPKLKGQEHAMTFFLSLLTISVLIFINKYHSQYQDAKLTS